jgi:uncharacterized membrane-anchored protein YjiN (DUF445 family)
MSEERKRGTQVIVRQDLVKVKTRALRLRIWFKTLSRIERAIMDLTLKCVERIRSHILEETITTILDKIITALEQGFLTKADDVGRIIAKRIAEIAEEWGNDAASTWKFDSSFIRFLGISTLNQ